jgi:hypothetical protein
MMRAAFSKDYTSIIFSLPGRSRRIGRHDKLWMFATLGLGLHAVQDFYAHSNWVELHPQGNDGAYRTETFWRAANLDKVESLKRVQTGKYPEDLEKTPDGEKVPKDAKNHGGYDAGLNKDSPPRPHWDEAYIFAYAASHELVGAMRTWSDEVRPGFWDSLREHTVTAKDAEKLEKDIVAARNISMWVKAQGQDGTWKGSGSGSKGFLSMFSSKWITAGSSDFVDIIHDGKVQKELVSGLYEKKTKHQIPSVEHYSLRRAAVVLRVTYAAERKEGTALLRRMTGISSDFYSRIIAGGQEYWGRTMQKSRESVDPWYEIFIVDPTNKELPISISVWDEDDIDAENDEHVDINPSPDARDLRFVFQLADSSLSGDISGIFISRDKPFSVEGAKPDSNRAAIRGFVFQRAIE